MNKLKKYHPYIYIGLFSLVINITLYTFGTFDVIESKFFDLKFKLRGSISDYEHKENDVVLVEIDDAAYNLINESYPFPRGKIYAKAIENLTKAKAKVIVFDVMFDSQDHTSKVLKNNISRGCVDCITLNQDEQFKNSISEAANKGTHVVLAAKIGKDINRVPMDYLVEPYKELMSVNPFIGLVNQGIEKSNFSHKKYYLINQLSSKPSIYYPSLALQSVLCYNESYDDFENIEWINKNTIKIGDSTIRTFEKEASMVVNYYGPVSSIFSTFKTYSLSQIIDDENYNLSNLEEDDNWMDKYINPTSPLFQYFGIDKSPFKDKVVVIGSSLEEDNDFIISPFFNYKGINKNMPGLELHANAIQQMIDKNYINISGFYNDNQNIILPSILIFLIIILTLFVSNLYSSIYSLLIILLSIVFWISLSIGSFLCDYLWIFKSILNMFLNKPLLFNYNLDLTSNLIPVFYPITSILLTYGLNLSYKIFKEQSDKNFLKVTFGKYVSPKIIDIMYDQKKIPELGGESGIRTAFFSDIQSFSTISEKLSSTELVTLLNEFLTSQTNIILELKGTLDKYEGDAIVAFFGAPIYFEKHAKAAIDAALKCNQNLSVLNKKWKSEGDKWPDLVHDMKMRIGINTGDMVTGNMGSDYHMNYTMIGDVVNTASRLESSAKQYGIYLHTTEETLNYAGKNNYIWRYIDKIQFVGKTNTIQTVEIIDFKRDDKNDKLNFVKIYHEGLEHFYKKEWDLAIEKFEKSLKYETKYYSKHINPSKVYIEKSKFYKLNPPLDNWDGATVLTKK